MVCVVCFMLDCPGCYRHCIETKEYDEPNKCSQIYMHFGNKRTLTCRFGICSLLFADFWEDMDKDICNRHTRCSGNPSAPVPEMLDIDQSAKYKWQTQDYSADQ